jgi:hypothetical protein
VSKPKSKQPDAVDALAAEIARDLFTVYGCGHADRLRCVDADGKYLGGWSEAAVRDRVAAAIRRGKAASEPREGNVNG